MAELQVGIRSVHRPCIQLAWVPTVKFVCPRSYRYIGIYKAISIYIAISICKPRCLFAEPGTLVAINSKEIQVGFHSVYRPCSTTKVW
jgi:hypothetical protein